MMNKKCDARTRKEWRTKQRRKKKKRKKERKSKSDTPSKRDRLKRHVAALVVRWLMAMACAPAEQGGRARRGPCSMHPDSQHVLPTAALVTLDGLLCCVLACRRARKGGCSGGSASTRITGDLGFYHGPPRRCAETTSEHSVSVALLWSAHAPPLSAIHGCPPTVNLSGDVPRWKGFRPVSFVAKRAEDKEQHQRGSCPGPGG